MPIWHLNPSAREASSPRLAGPLALTGWHQSAMGAFNALSSNLPLAAAKLLDELGLGPKRVEGASKELQDEKATRGVGPKKDGRRWHYDTSCRNNVEKSVVIALRHQHDPIPRSAATGHEATPRCRPRLLACPPRERLRPPPDGLLDLAG